MAEAEPSPQAVSGTGIEELIEVVEFMLGGKRYALDIQLVREIVVMMPITPIPRAPEFISGVLNLRGEITYIINLNKLLDVDNPEIRKDQKIIVFVSGAAKKNNVGIIVDNVSSVIQVKKEDIEKMNDSASSKVSGFVKGIIKLKSEDHEKKGKGLLIWIDMEKIFKGMVGE
ncbi:MAG: chemotaxis protein CheW [Methanoregula sp.]|nr:chemotaxis protein CheW [Methanoregula sp.]MDP2797579.1 chemotaxis protein CheW [Methanoregula sp.]